MTTSYTTNYKLDKYVATDKPNLRDQYNTAMDKIDAQMMVNATAANNAATAANNATSAADSAKATATAAQTTANAAQVTANTTTTKLANNYYDKTQVDKLVNTHEFWRYGQTAEDDEGEDVTLTQGWHVSTSIAKVLQAGHDNASEYFTFNQGVFTIVKRGYYRFAYQLWGSVADSTGRISCGFLHGNTECATACTPSPNAKCSVYCAYTHYFQKGETCTVREWGGIDVGESNWSKRTSGHYTFLEIEYEGV
jgi:hypothetical protein